MTPAINLLKQQGVVFRIREYEHAPDARSWGMEAAEKLGLNPDRVFKTLVTTIDNAELVVGIVPVSCQLDFKALARAAGAKKAHMAELALVEKTTGYVAGGVSPLGQKKNLPTFLDRSAGDFSTIFISGGRRGLDIELSPADLLRLVKGKYASLIRASG